MKAKMRLSFRRSFWQFVCLTNKAFAILSNFFFLFRLLLRFLVSPEGEAFPSPRALIKPEARSINYPTWMTGGKSV